MAVRRAGGQHTTEFALLLGITATVVIVMQQFAHEAIKRGVAHTTDTVLGELGCLDTDADGECDCSDLDRDGVCDDNTLKVLTVQAKRSSDERGDETFRRTTKTQEDLTGESVNEDVRFRVFGE